MPAMYDRKVQIVRHIGLLEGVFTLFVLATFIKYGINYLEKDDKAGRKEAKSKEG